MSTGFFGRARGLYWSALLAGSLATSSAMGQSAVAGWALNRLEPSSTGDPFFLAEHPWYSATRRYAVGLTLEHTAKPLVFREDVDGEFRVTAAVSAMLSGHVGAMVSFADRVGVGLSLPVSLLQDGTPVDDGLVLIGPAAGAALGDLRATLRVRLFGRADGDALSLHAGASVWAPTGAREANTGDAGFRVEPRVIAAGRVGALRWSSALGLHFRPAYRASNVSVDQELRLTAAVGLALLGDRLSVGPEAYVVTGLSDPSSQQGALFADGQWGGEALVGARYAALDSLQVGAGVAFGFGRGYGIPSARALVSLTWAPSAAPDAAPEPPADSDRDGVDDASDRCPTTPRGPHPDAAREGCPLADSDGDGVHDAIDECASEPQGGQGDPAHVGCPERDRDSDGVFDGRDLCPMLPQGPTPDPSRGGCPAQDTDGDGLSDHLDRCPQQPTGRYPDSARPGCPLPDVDEDGVPEPTDACPGRAGVPSSDPRRHGCPNPAVSIVGSELVLTRRLEFLTGKDRIKRDHREALQALVEVLRAAPMVRRVSIEAHTDDHSTPERDLELSQRRAIAVMRWLVERGVSAERLEAHGFGQSRPLAPNTSDRQRTRNARVEFRIVDPAPRPAAPVAPVAPATTVAPGAIGAAPVQQEGEHHGYHRRHRRR